MLPIVKPNNLIPSIVLLAAAAAGADGVRMHREADVSWPRVRLRDVATLEGPRAEKFADALVSTSPHVCGHDLYSLQIFPEPDALVMRWRIQSPDATTHITSTYALRSAPLRSPASAC